MFGPITPPRVTALEAMFVRVFGIFVVPIMIGALALFISGCASNKAIKFNIERDLFLKTFKTVVLAPISIPAGLENSEPIKTEIESLILNRLKEGGYSVVPPKEQMAIWKSVAVEGSKMSGPDQASSETQNAKQLRQRTLRELESRTSANAVLYAGIRVVNAPWSSDGISSFARWDGTSEKIKSENKSAVGTILTALSPVKVITHGTVPALSLLISIRDINNDEELYLGAAGIQILMQSPEGHFVYIPQSEILTSKERNTAAVNAVLAPLMR